MATADIDSETALVIAHLSLSDIDHITANRKGKAHFDTSLSDEELAFQIQTEAWKIYLTAIEDGIYARSIEHAIDTNRPLVTAMQVVEQGAADDRQAAVALDRGNALPERTVSQRCLEDKYFYQEEATATHVDDDAGWGHHENTMDTGESSTAPTVTRRKATRHDCSVCMNPIQLQTSLKAPCEHYYCQNCLIELVKAMLGDESLFPLRCCKKPIDTDWIKRLIPLEIVSAFETRSLEFGTLAMDRLYCPNPTCSVFLGSAVHQFSRDIACTTCYSRMCVLCRQYAHPEEASCRENFSIQEVRALAKEQHWQTCPNCKAIIELHHGCFHMTCRCRTEFCYRCAALWKTCDCDVWDEQRLIAVAEERENAVAEGLREQNPVLFQHRVEQRVVDLRYNHDCDPHWWTGRSGGTCEECGDWLPQFLKRCRTCGISVCRRCARNRL